MNKAMELVRVVCSAAAGMYRSGFISPHAQGFVRMECEAVVASDAPKTILVIPWGVSERHDNQTLVMDDESAASCVNAFTQQGVDLVIDFEHQTEQGEYASLDGTALAAGWIKRLFSKPGEGLFADVEWTERGFKLVSSKGYSYLSPVVYVDLVNRHVQSLISVGLTNKPAIRSMPRLVNSQEASMGSGVIGDLHSLIASLTEGTAPSTEELVAQLKTILEAVQGVTGKAAGAMVSERSANSFWRSENAKLRGQIRDLEFDMLVNKHVDKLPPSQQDWFKNYFRMDPAGARKHIEGLPKLVYTTNDIRSGPLEATSAGGPGRAVVIANARRTYGEAVHGGKNVICSEAAWVNQALREQHLARLTSDEVKTQGIKLEAC